MEFSFDRSRDNNLNNSNTTNTGPARPQQAQGFGGTSQVRSGPDINSQDPSTIANERLRKAIERNRAKQAEREAQRATQQPQANTQSFGQRPTFTPPPRPEMRSQPRQTVETHEYEHEQESFFSQAAHETMSSARMNARAQEAEPVRERVRTTRTASPKEATAPVVSRRSVAKPENTEFVPVKRTSRKVSSQVSYTTSSTRKKTKSLNPKYADYLVKGCWIFCAIMVLRLIFAAGGVTSFYSQKNVVKLKQNELASIKKENMHLVREIERMKSDAGYQKD